MRNPFNTTQEYTIVRQNNRINGKKRCLSSSFNSSTEPKQFQRYCNYPAYQTATTGKPDTHCDYLPHLRKATVYELERKRVQLFGLEELRYKPAYFTSIGKSQEKQQQTNKKVEKVFRPTVLKSQKSVKQPIITQKKLAVPTQKHIKQRAESKRLLRRRSILEQMVDLRGQVTKNNQFYTSVINLKSRMELCREPKQYQQVHSKRARKNSVFHEQFQKLVEFHVCSEIQQIPKSKLSLPNQENVEGPDSILIKGRKYYRYYRKGRGK